MLQKHLKIQGEVSRNVCLFFVVFFLLTTQTAPGQPFQENKALTAAYDHILALQLEKGRNELKDIHVKDEHEKGFALYALNLADILEMLLSEDPELYSKNKHLEKERLASVDELSDTNPWKRFCEAEIKLQWAFVKVKNGDELNAVWNFSQSYKAIVANSEEFHDFLPNKKTTGVFNIIFGAVPQKYQWLLNFFSMKGSTEDGVESLEYLAETEELLALESNILLLLTNAYLMDNATAAIQKLTSLSNGRKENKLLKYLLGITLIKNSQAEKALQVIQEADNLHTSYLPIVYTEYLKGEIMLQMGKYQQASVHYAAFILNYKGENFIKDTYYKLFLANYLNGNDNEAQSFREKAKDAGVTITEADKYAEKQISGESNPNKDILKIRLATDGGFYKRADSLIQRFTVADFTNQKDQVEFIYRKARLYDKCKLTEKAITQYKLTLEKAGNHNWYFAPNAALQLGYLYAAKGAKEKAISYFERALSYKNYEYKNSIDHKAKAALQSLD